MENFIPLAETIDSNILMAEYEKSLDFDKIAVGEKIVFFNRFARVEYLPISIIERVYRSVGGINPNQCCNTAFDVFTLVVEYNGGVVEGRVMYEFQFQEIMDALEIRNPNINFTSE